MFGHHGDMSSHRGKHTDDRAYWRTQPGERRERADRTYGPSVQRRSIGEPTDVWDHKQRLTAIRAKDSDTTWLYGLFKPANTQIITHYQCNMKSNVSRNTSVTHRKPTLKGRRSEVVPQPIFPASTLLKPVATAIRIQGGGSAFTKKASKGNCSEFASHSHSRSSNIDQVDYSTSKSTSGSHNARLWKRRIRFDNKVEQCIAVDCTYKANEEDTERTVVKN